MSICVLSKWCCVHDIHGPAPDPDEDASIEELLSPAHLNQRPHTFARHRVLSRDDMRSTWTNEPLEGRGEGSIATGLRQLADLISSESDLSPVLREAEAHLQQQAAVRRSSPRIIVTTRRYEPEVADAASGEFASSRLLKIKVML